MLLLIPRSVLRSFLKVSMYAEPSRSVGIHNVTWDTNDNYLYMILNLRSSTLYLVSEITFL